MEQAANNEFQAFAQTFRLPTLMLLPWPWLHLHKDSNNWPSPSKVFPSHIGCSHPIPLSLSHITWTAQGETKIEQDATKFSLATHCKWCVQTCTKMSLICPSGISNNAKWKASALPSSRAPFVLSHWSFRTATEDHQWKSTCRFYNRNVPKNDTSDPHIQNQGDVNCDNVPEQLHQAIWNNFICIARQWSPFCEQALYNLLSFHRDKEAHQNSLTPADKWAGWTLPQIIVAYCVIKYAFQRQETWDTHVQPLAYDYNTQTNHVTGPSPFNIIFPRQPTSDTTSARLTRARSDMQKDTKLRHTNQRLLECVVLMRAALRRRMTATQENTRTITTRRFDANRRYVLVMKHDVHRPPQTPSIGFRFSWRFLLRKIISKPCDEPVDNVG